MKAVLEFTLPEESEEHRLALSAGAYYAIISELDSWLRGLEKYGDVDTIRIEEVRRKIAELSNRYGVDL